MRPALASRPSPHTRVHVYSSQSLTHHLQRSLGILETRMRPSCGLHCCRPAVAAAGLVLLQQQVVLRLQLLPSLLAYELHTHAIDCLVGYGPVPRAIDAATLSLGLCECSTTCCHCCCYHRKSGDEGFSFRNLHRRILQTVTEVLSIGATRWTRSNCGRAFI
jgi:hypothetical protein